VVADALSHRAESLGSLAYLPEPKRPMAMDVQALASQFLRLDLLEPSWALACVVSRSSLFDHIRERQYDNRDVTIGDNGVLRMQGWICVPNVDGLRELIPEEAHSSRYSIHPGVAKMY